METSTSRRLGEPPRRAWVETIMGMPVSIHLRSWSAASAEEAVQRCFAELREADRTFSPYQAGSEVSRIGRGELALADASADVREVAAACREAETRTGGLFSAAWRASAGPGFDPTGFDPTGFDPTGLVKGWAVERAARRHLQPLVGEHLAAGINAGGDLQLFTDPHSTWRWRVGIADPRRPGSVLASLDIAEGAVATSGTAERGHHIVDPRTGLPASGGVISATVVADGLAHADVWATAAVVSGFDDLSWLPAADVRTGITVCADGRTRRWVGGIPVTVSPATGLAAA